MIVPSSSPHINYHEYRRQYFFFTHKAPTTKGRFNFLQRMRYVRRVKWSSLQWQQSLQGHISAASLVYLHSSHGILCAVAVDSSGSEVLRRMKT